MNEKKIRTRVVKVTQGDLEPYYLAQIKGIFGWWNLSLTDPRLGWYRFGNEESALRALQRYAKGQAQPVKKHVRFSGWLP